MSGAWRRCSTRSGIASAPHQLHGRIVASPASDTAAASCHESHGLLLLAPAERRYICYGVSMLKLEPAGAGLLMILALVLVAIGTVFLLGVVGL
jgi:hypothetical protein